jgi:hypothetical protein
MPIVQDAQQAENMVREYYANPVGQHPFRFETHKQGNTWVVAFDIRSVGNLEQHEWHIDSVSGNVLSRR